MRWIFILLLFFLIFVSVGACQTSTEPVSGLVFSESDTQCVAFMKDLYDTSAHQPSNRSSLSDQVIAALLAVLLATGINICFNKRRSKRELSSLILVFACELTLAFERCVMYYEQAGKGMVSFSVIFDFIDASIVSRFAAVNPHPEVVTAIMELKSTYFQIRRHVENVARFATQGDRFAKGTKERKLWMSDAIRAQRTALVLFYGAYDRTVEKTALIIDKARKICPGKVVEDLEKRFTNAKKKKDELDKPKPVEKKKVENENKS